MHQGEAKMHRRQIKDKRLTSAMVVSIICFQLNQNVRFYSHPSHIHINCNKVKPPALKPFISMHAVIPSNWDAVS